MRGYKIVISNKQNKVRIPTGFQLLVRRCCNAVLQEERVKLPAEIGINFLDNEHMQALNKEYRNVDAATDVLSFSLGEDGVYEKNLETGGTMLGDVAISLEMAMAHAKRYAHSFEREVGFLVVHGILHILGYDHEKGLLEAEEMHKKEETIMSKVGLELNVSGRGSFLRV
ncbi:endoribonuclease YbeY [Clostridia bacterium]|nr:endoribonuclease YbeY [Clostridia bacterium]